MSYRVSDKFGSKRLDAVNVILRLALLITCVSVFVPFSPTMPGPSLDGSWAFGLNQAVAQGLVFGKDIVFTFGPYASIYGKTYHPSTDLIMVCGSLYLAASYWASFVLLVKGVHWRWVLIFCLILTSMTYSMDVLLFSYPLLVGLASYRLLLLEDATSSKRKSVVFRVALLFAPFGLLPLIKGTVLILCTAIAVLSSVLFSTNKRGILAITSLASPAVSIIIFWTISGQSPKNLPYYLAGMVPIVSGYTEAMAWDGDLGEVVVYCAASIVVLLSIFSQKQLTSTSRIFFSALYFVFLFISAKGGFVRHDEGHGFMSGVAILTAAVLLPFIPGTRVPDLAVIVAIIAWSYIDSSYRKTSTASIYANVSSTYLSAWNGIKQRLKDRGWPRRDFDVTVKSLESQSPLPLLRGTTDIYSFDQSYLIASGNTWSPRPIFQSYSVYTPELAEKNRKHLIGRYAPDNIIFRVEPIDGRLPSIEDGASWPTLLANYEPARMENKYLFLRKKQVAGEPFEHPKPIRETHSFGESVNLPQASQPLFAKIEIGPTAWGRAASILFKPSQLVIGLELKNGKKKRFRLVSGMVKAGFVISPLVEDTAEFGMLYGKSSYLDGKLVKSFSIAPRDGQSRLWNNKYAVTYSLVKATSPIDISRISNFERFQEWRSAYELEAYNCEGFIDTVNGMSPAPVKFSASGVLRVDGWVASSVAKATLPETAYVILTDGNGGHSYVKAHRTPRPDVAAYFNRPELEHSGFSISADISALSGDYMVGVGVEVGDKIKRCRQFNVSVAISK